MLLYRVFMGIHYFLSLLNILLLVYWVMSLFRLSMPIYDILERFLEPLMAPFRVLNAKLMNRIRSSIRIDFSIWFTMIALSLADRVLWGVYSLLR